jgi:hypothetical protein
MQKSKKKKDDDSSFTSIPIKKTLRSKRFDAMYIPNTTWDFFDAFTKSTPCQLAFNNEHLSSEHLDKYMAMTHKTILEEERERNRIPQRALPPMIDELLKCQSRSGKFESLAEVSRILRLPPVLIFKRRNDFEEWEKATALAVAAMRQRIEFFEEIFEQHEMAAQWVQSGELISDARELFAAKVGTFESMNTLPASSLGDFTPTATAFFNNTNSSTVYQEVIGGGGGIITTARTIQSATSSYRSDEYGSEITPGRKQHQQSIHQQQQQQQIIQQHSLEGEGSTLLTDLSVVSSGKYEKMNPSHHEGVEEEDEQGGGDDNDTKASNESQESEFDFSSILTKDLPSLSELSKQPSQSAFNIKGIIGKLAGDFDHEKINAQKALLADLEVRKIKNSSLIITFSF